MKTKIQELNAGNPVIFMDLLEQKQKAAFLL